MSEQRETKTEKDRSVSRRLFLKGLGSGAAGATAIAATSIPGLEEAAYAVESGQPVGPGPVPIELQVNGKACTVEAEPRETLLEVLRNRLDITGPKLVCDSGSCGACTVYLDGTPVYACMTLAIMAQGKKIETIESLSDGGELHPVQEAFIEADAMQCGFCTPGFVMSMAAVFKENPSATLVEVKEGIAGHICRCGTYKQIFDAAETVRKTQGG